jgi:GntR family transcriptional regulator/MocR family aminotransferase
VAALESHFGADVEVLGDPAGMHVMVRFADPEVASRAHRNKVQLLDASAYYLDRAPANAFILGFSAVGERAIREGVRRLAP